MKRDRMDVATYATAAALAVALGVLLLGRAPESDAVHPQRGDGRAVADQERLALERTLGHYPPAAGDRESLEAFLAENPGNSRAHFHLGELLSTDGRLDAAARRFRLALGLDRGYADATSPLYRGDLLRRFVEDGLRIYGREKGLRPEDAHVREVIKDLYFIRRSLAGGCD